MDVDIVYTAPVQPEPDSNPKAPADSNPTAPPQQPPPQQIHEKENDDKENEDTLSNQIDKNQLAKLKNYCNKKIPKGTKINKMLENHYLFQLPAELIVGVSRTQEVTVEDLLCLQGNNWVNDATINYFFHILQINCTKQKKPTLLFTTHFWSKLKDDIICVPTQNPTKTKQRNQYVIGTKSKINNWTKPGFWKKNKLLFGSIFDYKNVLIPVHHRKNHWILIEINMDNKTVWIYNSMSMSQSSIDEYFRICMQYLLMEVLHKKMDPNTIKYNEWTKLQCIGFGVQRESWECGILTMYCALTLINNDPPEDIQCNNIIAVNEYKLKIIKEIVNFL